MSNEVTPISPARFAAALKDLPLSTLHLKAAEIRNSIAHLDYSNEQLKPFADGTDPSAHGRPDQDCIDAIKENEIVIARMQERIALLKAEVEGRGSSWQEFLSPDELRELQQVDQPLVNGTEEEEDTGIERQELSEVWRDGTFQTGRIVNGEIRMDGESRGNASANGTRINNGGRLDDEALRRAMEERMRGLADDGDEHEGMHL
jgi:hypothetical protein